MADQISGRIAEPDRLVSGSQLSARDQCGNEKDSEKQGNNDRLPSFAPERANGTIKACRSGGLVPSIIPVFIGHIPGWAAVSHDGELRLDASIHQ